MQRKTLLQHYLFQSLAGVRMIPKSGRVLEGNPITMEYYRYCIIAKTSKRDRGSVHGRSVPCRVGRPVKSKTKREL